MRDRREAGSAVVEFTLVTLILVPLVLGLIQLGITLHVRNTLAAAASEGARQAAREGATLDDGAQVTRDRVAATIADGYLTDVTAQLSTVEGATGVQVRARAGVPAFGLFGPAITLEVTGRAVREEIP